MKAVTLPADEAATTTLSDVFKLTRAVCSFVSPSLPQHHLVPVVMEMCMQARN